MFFFNPTMEFFTIMSIEILLILSFCSLVFSGKVLTLADEELRKSQSIIQKKLAVPVRPYFFGSAATQRGIEVKPQSFVRPTESVGIRPAIRIN